MNQVLAERAWAALTYLLGHRDALGRRVEDLLPPEKGSEIRRVLLDLDAVAKDRTPNRGYRDPQDGD